MNKKRLLNRDVCVSAIAERRSPKGIRKMRIKNASCLIQTEVVSLTACFILAALVSSGLVVGNLVGKGASTACRFQSLIRCDFRVWFIVGLNLVVAMAEELENSSLKYHVLLQKIQVSVQERVQAQPYIPTLHRRKNWFPSFPVEIC